jgi:hypothetical protein
LGNDLRKGKYDAEGFLVCVMAGEGLPMSPEHTTYFGGKTGTNGNDLTP